MPGLKINLFNVKKIKETPNAKNYFEARMYA